MIDIAEHAFELTKMPGGQELEQCTICGFVNAGGGETRACRTVAKVTFLEGEMLTKHAEIGPSSDMRWSACPSSLRMDVVFDKDDLK